MVELYNELDNEDKVKMVREYLKSKINDDAIKASMDLLTDDQCLEIGETLVAEPDDGFGMFLTLNPREFRINGLKSTSWLKVPGTYEDLMAKTENGTKDYYDADKDEVILSKACGRALVNDPNFDGFVKIGIILYDDYIGIVTPDNIRYMF